MYENKRLKVGTAIAVDTIKKKQRSPENESREP
jgi:hypothetical protein